MKLKSQNYIKVISTVWMMCFLVSLLMYMLLLQPMQEKNRHLEKVLAEKRQAYELIIQIEQEQIRRHLTEQIDNLRECLHRFVLEPDGMADLIFNISQMVNEKKVESLNIKNIQTNKKWGSLRDVSLSEDYIDISFDTSFNNFASILNSLERNKPVIFIDKFIVTRNDESLTKTNVRMNLAVFVGSKKDFVSEKIVWNQKNREVELSKASQ